LKLILATALLVMGAEAHCHPYSCDKAKERLQLCLNHGYKPEKLEGCKLQDGDWEMSDIQKKICKDLENNVEKDKCDFVCEKDEGEKWPGEGWTAVDLAPSQASELDDLYGGKEMRFAIFSEPVEYEDTRVQMVVKFLKPFTKMTSLYPAVELLDDNDKVLGSVVLRLQYFVNDGNIQVGGSFGLRAEEQRKNCRSDGAMQDLRTDEGPDVTFYLNQDRVVATFSGDHKVEVKFDKDAACVGDVMNAFDADEDATTKVRFALNADASQTDHLGEFVAVKYKFMETPP